MKNGINAGIFGGIFGGIFCGIVGGIVGSINGYMGIWIGIWEGIGIGIVTGIVGGVVGGIFAFLLDKILLNKLVFLIFNLLEITPNKKIIKKNYPKLSIIGIMRERKSNQELNSIYLVLMTTIIYIITGKIFHFAISNIILYVLLIIVLLIALELFVFNYRINKGWYGNSELEAKEIIRFIISQSENIDFTDGNNLKVIIRPEDIKTMGEELGIQFPGYPEPNAMNKGFSEG